MKESKNILEINSEKLEGLFGFKPSKKLMLDIERESHKHMQASKDKVIEKIKAAKKNIILTPSEYEQIVDSEFSSSTTITIFDDGEIRTINIFIKNDDDRIMGASEYLARQLIESVLPF